METSKVKVNCSDIVARAVKKIKGLQGKKNKLDTHYEYEKLSQLLADVQAGKLDKNMMKNDELYIKGLQLEYQSQYLGDEGTGSNTSDATKKENGAAPNPPAPKEDAEKGEPASEGTKTPTKPHNTPQPAQESKPQKEPELQGKKQPRRRIPFRPQGQQEPPQYNSWSSDVRNKGNNTAKDGSVVVTGDGNVIINNGGGEDASKTGKAAGAASSTRTTPQKPNPQKMLNESAKNYTKAFADGEQVAEDLIGYTTTKEKQNAIRLIMKQQPATIMGFISGFNDNDTVMGFPYGKGGLLDQVDNEYGWTDSEKKEVFSKVINTTLRWAKACGFENDSNYESLQTIANQLKTAGKIDTERTDLLVKELISRGTARAGI